MKKLIAVVLVLGCGAAQAATLIIQTDSSGNNILMGATGVEVGGLTYSVSFVDGSCVSLFSGCDALEDFTFATEQTAAEAILAVKAQVFTGDYAIVSDMTNGCDFTVVSCQAGTPYALEYDATWGLRVATKGAWHKRPDPASSAYPGGGLWSPTLDLSASGGHTFVLFTLTAVPIPAAVWLFGSGLGLLGFLRRRSQS